MVLGKHLDRGILRKRCAVEEQCKFHTYPLRNELPYVPSVQTYSDLPMAVATREIAMVDMSGALSPSASRLADSI